jgi:hypothetical protein
MNSAEKIYEHIKALPEPAVLEILDFVEFITMKIGRSESEAPNFRKKRLHSMRAARGIWQDRDDLPNFQALRHEWDRAQGEGS